MKFKTYIGIILITLIVVGMSACSSSKELAYPNGYVSTGEEDSDKTSSDSNSKSNRINYFLDNSASSQRSTQVVGVHSVAIKSGAGKEKHYYTLTGHGDNKKILETNERFILGDQHGDGAIVDLMGSINIPANIPVDSKGVNVMTTDLQSKAIGTKIGEWLVQTGSTGYTFYVFDMNYSGYIDFYVGDTEAEKRAINNCSFRRKFLMIVFGDDDVVKSYDEAFQKGITSTYALASTKSTSQESTENKYTYDVCHVSLNKENMESNDGIELLAGKCFKEKVSDITYDNTNYSYGLSLVDTSDINFLHKNTFVYQKNNINNKENEEAVKAVLYTTSAIKASNITDKKISVSKYDSDTEKYVENENVSFDINIKDFEDGIVASGNSEINKKLDGDIVSKGTQALMITVENKDLPKGLYAIDVELLCNMSNSKFEDFADKYSAGLEEYVAALKVECKPVVKDGKVSTTSYIYSKKTGSNIYSRLLDFDKIADELIAAGATDNDSKITFHIVIDNR